MADLVFPGQTPGAPALNLTALPANKDLVIYKGDFVDVLVPVTDQATGLPKDLTGYTARAALKTSYSDTSPVLFEATIPSPTSGNVRVYLSSALSATLVAGSYIWDIEVINSVNDARTAMTGDVTVYPEVTSGNTGVFSWTVNGDPATYRGDAAGTPSASGQYLYTRFNVIQQFGSLTNLTCTVQTQTTGGANGISTATLASPPALWTPNAPTTWTSVPDYGTNATSFVLTATNPATITKLQANWTGLAAVDFPTTYTFASTDFPNLTIAITATLTGTGNFVTLTKVTTTKVVG